MSIKSNQAQRASEQERNITLAKIKKLKSTLNSENGIVSRLTAIRQIYEAYNSLNDYKGFAERDETNEEKQMQKYCEQYIKEFRDNSQKLNTLSANTKSVLSDGYFRAHVLEARYSLHHFAVALEWSYPLSRKFYYPRSCILVEWFKELQNLERGLYDGMSISAPPRSGKTGAGFIFLLWVILRHPEKSCLFVSHSNKVVKMMYDKFEKWFVEPKRHIFECFPEVGHKNQSAEDKWIDLGYTGESKFNDYHTVYFASIESGLAGHCEYSHLLYCDDLISGTEEAKNPDRLDTVWEKYSGDIVQRAAEDNVKELHIATRWGTQDVISRIEQDDEKITDWKFIKIPALNDDGESNFNFLVRPLTKEHFEKIQNIVDDYTWYAVYMQDPQEKEGLMFPEKEMKFFKELPKEPPDDIFCACDVAFSGIDSLSMPMAYQYGNDIYIVDVVFDSRGYKYTEPVVKNFIVKHSPTKAYFEAENGGEFYANDIRRIIENEVKTRIFAVRSGSKLSKEARIEQYEPDIKELYFLHPSMRSGNSAYTRFMKELYRYNANGRNKHDDAPDSLAMLVSKAKKVGGGMITFNLRKLF